ncbi:hypothetical protein TrLO_g13462 [Triparma laevis f. longispina]|uniref:Uncharacterized protein n=1 Tax=Triparma laevis f. longispina TaxID=1714387 RepID=A0A9W7A2H2_9STRA|nr:hypothetical protein TrLO_g13462 [Triparma laevis f. longispina]
MEVAASNALGMTVWSLSLTYIYLLYVVVVNSGVLARMSACFDCSGAYSSPLLIDDSSDTVSYPSCGKDTCHDGDEIALEAAHKKAVDLKYKRMEHLFGGIVTTNTISEISAIVISPMTILMLGIRDAEWVKKGVGELLGNTLIILFF